MVKPRYMQIADSIQDKIRTRQLEAGSILPTENELMALYQVSRITIRNALSKLVDEGLLYRIQGSGTYVKSDKIHHDALSLKGFLENVQEQGKTARCDVRRFELIKAPQHIAEALDVPLNTAIYHVERLKYIDDEAEILNISYFPLALFPDLSIEIMRSSKFDYIEKSKGLHVSHSKKIITAVLSNKSLASALSIKVGQPILKTELVSYLTTGEPFEYSVNYYTMKQFNFEIIAKRSASE